MAHIRQMKSSFASNVTILVFLFHVLFTFNSTPVLLGLNVCVHFFYFFTINTVYNNLISATYFQ